MPLDSLEATRFRDGTYIESQRKTFYPIKVPIVHYQLRHYISTFDKDTVYYISEREVWALRTKSQRRERIATLSFLPQCLGAGYGWICVGGYGGRCAFIDIRHCRPFSPAWPAGPSRSEVDALLPLYLTGQPRINYENLEESSHANINAWIRTKIHPREIGHNIVNSITVSKLQAGQKDLNDEEVAIISSNDKTIQIYSLRQLRTLKVLPFPCQMNHASISPDGELLIACGDEMAAFFFRRVTIPGFIHDGNLKFARFDWVLLAAVKLKATVGLDTCFSTAFSSSGSICTFASQFGTMTVFDTSLLRKGMNDEEAVIDIFTSTRPARAEETTKFQNMPGAIRSVAFSPEPWELLAWAEDQGRVCIVDLRDGFRSRQILELDINAVGSIRVELVESGSDEDGDEINEADTEDFGLNSQPLILHPPTRTSADSRNTLASVQSNADYIEQSAEQSARHRIHTEILRRRQGNDYIPPDLTDAEREILETLRVERLRDRSYRSAQRLHETVRGLEDRRDEAASATYPFSIHYSGVPGPSSYAPPGPPNTSIRQYMRERNLERSSSSPLSRAYPPRRRSSVMISNSNSTNSAATSSASSSLAPISGNANFSTSPSPLAASINRSDTSLQSLYHDNWHTISLGIAALAAPRLPSPTVDESTLSPDEHREWQRQQSLEAQEAIVGEQRRSRQRELEEARAHVLEMTGIDYDSVPDVREISRLAREQVRIRNRISERDNDHPQDTSAWRTGEDSTNLLARQQQQHLLQNRAAAVNTGNTMSGLDFTGGAHLAPRVHGPAIMGLGWSGDGRKLFVATEGGIFEFDVKTQQRKYFPSIRLR